MPATASLLKFQIGPVQDFIAQARSTRDLWSGSYLLSWLVAVGIQKFIKDGGTLIFPSTEKQPLLDLETAKIAKDHTLLLTPNLPNIFIGSIPADQDARSMAAEVKNAINKEWRRIATAVWEKRSKFYMPDAASERFFAQVDRHLCIAWQITPVTNDYLEAYCRNGWQLDAVRQTRDFSAWESGQGNCDKDSLSGREEAVIGGKEWFEGIKSQPAGYAFLFKHPDHLGAVNVIKRVWHLAYLENKHDLKTDSKKFVIRSTRGIATRDYSEGASDDTDTELARGEKYLAAIAFDGDSIGQWVSGDLLSHEKRKNLRGHHEDFSKALSAFALKEVSAVINLHDGFLIYAGGDDVVALVPADTALACAKELREKFLQATKCIEGIDPDTKIIIHPDASVGIAIAHVNSPLQDLIREAQKAEKRAKTTIGRPAFSVTLMKRSGEISHWGSKWDSGGLNLYMEISKLLGNAALSAKFPHRVCQLLEPYLTGRSGISEQEDAITPDTAVDVILHEFSFAIDRQSYPKSKSANQTILTQAAATYLGSLKQAHPSEIQPLITSFLGLCSTVAFADSNRAAAPTAEKQPLS